MLSLNKIFSVSILCVFSFIAYILIGLFTIKFNGYDGILEVKKNNFPTDPYPPCRRCAVDFGRAR